MSAGPSIAAGSSITSDRGGQYVSIKYTERLAEAGIEPSVGSVGDSYDNALAETINGLYKAEVIHRRGPWRTFEAVEFATLEWVDWFNNRRLLEPIGNKAYVDNANKLIAGTDLENETLENIAKKASGDPAKAGLFNNAAQIWNHSFYWQCLKPGGGGAPKGAVASKITSTWGSADKFFEELKNAGVTQFGSGWAWLVLENGELKITKTANADTPLVHGQKPLCDHRCLGARLLPRLPEPQAGLSFGGYGKAHQLGLCERLLRQVRIRGGASARAPFLKYHFVPRAKPVGLPAKKRCVGYASLCINPGIYADISPY